MICQKCEVEFESKRMDAKYCSDKCRKADKRGIISDIKVDASEIISDKPIMSDTEKKQPKYPGHYQGWDSIEELKEALKQLSEDDRYVATVISGACGMSLREAIEYL